MYSNNSKKGFSLLDLIAKVIFAGLFIFILVWLFQKKVPNMAPFYSNVFRENIKYMQEAGESYFTDDKMPSEIGDSSKITLQEMIDSNLVLPFVDQNGNACDTKNSYVSLTKTENGYDLKTNLVCPTESNYTIKKLGCHNFCDSAKCNVCEPVNITQYQFRKLVSSNKTTYSCPSGYTLKGKSCVKTILIDTKSAEVVQTTTKTISEPADVIVDSGSTTKLTTIVSESISTIDATANKKTSTIAATPTTTTVAAITSTSTIAATPSKSTKTVPYECTKTKTERQCSTVYQQVGYSCNCTSTIGPTGKTITTCSTCYHSVPVESCNNVTVPYKTTCYKEESSTTYSCPSGYTQNGTKCTKTTYSCPSGYAQNGTKCTKTTYSCPSKDYVLNGTKCSITTTTYSCPSGYTQNGTKCTKTVKTYTCPAGTDIQTGSGVTLACYKVVQGSYHYECKDKSYTLNGDKCYKTIKETSTEYQCDSGYKLEGKLCKKYSTDTKKATSKTVKTQSYKYTWSEKEKLSGWERTGKTKIIQKEGECASTNKNNVVVNNYTEDISTSQK